jgi:hypothetical protein
VPWTGEGSHGGGDTAMLKDIFSATPVLDKYLRASDERGGAASILVGIAANRCLETRSAVKIADLVPGLVRPDYPNMPSSSAPLPMPSRIRLP